MVDSDFNFILIGSFNIRGINNLEKILYLRDKLESGKVEVCFLQETHLDSKKSLSSLEKNIGDYKVFTNLCENKSKGVAILVKNNLVVENFSFEEDRYVALDLFFEKKIYNLVNIYCPNRINEQIEFIEKLDVLISKKKNIILGGDFNSVEDNSVDRIGSSSYKEVSKNQKSWNKFYKFHDLIEIKNKNNISNQMTWTNGVHSSRIDRFYSKHTVFESLEYHDNIYSYISDHSLIVCKLKFKHNIHVQTNYTYSKDWKLNETVLENDRVHDAIIKLCNNIKNIEVLDWYEIFIEKIIKLLKRESRIISKEKKEKINSLFIDLSKANKLSRTEENIKIISETEIEIENYYKEKREGIERRACEIKRNFIFQPSKILLEKEKNNGSKNFIEKFQLKNKNITDDKALIMNDIYEFYNNLLGKEKVRNSTKNIDFKIKSLDQILDKDLKNSLLNKLITYDEASKVIKNMKSSAPGPNGLPFGFFKKYFEHFGPHFIKLLNNNDGILSKTFKESTIKLIPKNKNKIKSVDDLRPIAL